MVESPPVACGPRGAAPALRRQNRRCKRNRRPSRAGRAPRSAPRIVGLSSAMRPFTIRVAEKGARRQAAQTPTEAGPDPTPVLVAAATAAVRRRASAPLRWASHGAFRKLDGESFSSATPPSGRSRRPGPSSAQMQGSSRATTCGHRRSSPRPTPRRAILTTDFPGFGNSANTYQLQARGDLGKWATLSSAWSAASSARKRPPTQSSATSPTPRPPRDAGLPHTAGARETREGSVPRRASGIQGPCG